MASDPAHDPVSQLAAVASGIASDTAALGALAPQVTSLAAANVLAGHRLAVLAKWVETQHPGAVVSMLVRDPYISVNIPPPVVPPSTSIVIYPTIGQLMVGAGTVPGSSFNVNYQGGADTGYPWDQVPQSRVYEEIANCNAVATEEVVFGDSHMVPTVTSTTSVGTSFSGPDGQIALGNNYGIQYLIYLLSGPGAYGPYTTAINAAGGNRAAALQMMTTVINAVVPHFKGRVKGYVIFNEVIQFGGYNSNTFTNLMGTSFTGPNLGAHATACDLIHAADPGAEIWINTNHVETDGTGDGNQWTFFLNQAIGLKNAGHFITGVSMESHLSASLGNNVYTQLRTRLNQATAAGLQHASGEPDVTDDTNLAAGPAGITARDTTSASIFNTFFTNFLTANAKPAHIIPWEWTHGTSWLNSPPATVGGSPYDRQAHTTDGDGWTINGTRYNTHQIYPTGAQPTASGNIISLTVAPGITTTITSGTAVTFTKGINPGSTIAFTGSLQVNATVNGTVQNPVYLIQIKSTGTLTGTSVEGTHGRPCVGFDEAGNLVPAYLSVRKALTALCPGGVAPSASTIAAVGGSQRYYVAMLDNTGALVSPQPTFQLHSSNTGVASVPNNPTSAGANGTFLVTATGTGTALITATAGGVTSNAMTLSIGTQSHPNEPAGMTTVMGGEAMTGTPATTQNGTWKPGTTDGAGNLVTFTNLSPTTAVPLNGNQSAGQWAGNVTRDASGSGQRMTYLPALNGGFSPARVQCQAFRTQGTGTMYIAGQFTASANWTNNGNSETKYFDLHTNGAENHIIVGQVDTNGTGSPLDLFLALFLQGPAGQSRLVPNGNPTPYATSEPSANLGGGNRGNTFTFEIVVVQDSPAGAGNGTYQAWINGGSVFGPQTGLTYLAAGETPGWKDFLFDPTYGGGTHSPPNVSPNIFWTIDHLYVSVK